MQEVGLRWAFAFLRYLGQVRAVGDYVASGDPDRFRRRLGRPDRPGMRDLRGAAEQMSCVQSAPNGIHPAFFSSDSAESHAVIDVLRSNTIDLPA